MSRIVSFFDNSIASEMMNFPDDPGTVSAQVKSLLEDLTQSLNPLRLHNS